MNVCILAKDIDVEKAREKARRIEEFSKHQNVLGTPLSESGLKPITHWFCSYNSSEEMISHLKSIQEFTEIETVPVRTFLRKHKLKIVDRMK